MEVITVDSESYKTFAEALHEINEYLAKKIAGDGEGATALFEVTVVGADTKRLQRHLQNQSYAQILPRQQLQDMMQTGEESSVQWDIPEHSLTWKRWICSSRARQERSRSSKMVQR